MSAINDKVGTAMALITPEEAIVRALLAPGQDPAVLSDRRRVLREMAAAIRLLGDADPQWRENARRDIGRMTAPRAPASDMAVAYAALAEADPEAAFALYRDL